MLALIRSSSWKSGGGYARWSRAHFTDATSQSVLPEAEERLVQLLNSCFLHTPAEIIFRQGAPQRTLTKLSPSELEAVSYNYVLSLHQRDVLRAGLTKTRPAEWQLRSKQSESDRARSKQSESKEPSAEKTVTSRRETEPPPPRPRWPVPTGRLHRFCGRWST